MQLKTLVPILANGLLLACAPSLRSGSASDVVVFRQGELAERYDFRYHISGMSSHAVWDLENCSSSRFHCLSGATVLIGPRSCAVADRLLRSRADWAVSRKIKARFVFQAGPDRYYFSSDDSDREHYVGGSDGFVYDPRRGIVGVWHSASVFPPAPEGAARDEIINKTRVIDPGQSLFPCRP
jgi:hypothetical protein